MRNMKNTYWGGGYSSSVNTAQTYIYRLRVKPKRVLLLCLLLLCLLSSLSAHNVEWSWSDTDEKVNYYRYQLNGTQEGKWTVVDSTTTSVVLPIEKSENTLHVQSSYDGSLWSDTAIGQYTKEEYKSTLSLSLNLAPYSAGIFYFYNGHYIDNARTLMGTIYGLSTGIELDWRVLPSLRLYPEVGYSYEMKIQTVIPKRQDMHYIKAGGGVDFLFAISDKADLFLGAFGGAMAHINNNKMSIAPYFGSRFGLDYELSSHITLGAFARVSASFLNTTEYLYNSMTLLIDPVSLSLSYVF